MAADIATLGIQVDLSQLNAASRALREFERAAESVEQSVQETGRSFSGARREADAYSRATHNTADAADNLNRRAHQTAGGVELLKKAVLGLVSVHAAQALFGIADRMQSLDNQIKQVTGSERALVSVRKELLAISNRTYADLEATGALYVKTQRALERYGYTQKEVLKFVEATNNAMAVGGAGAQEQASALFQLSQALASGRLQGDEFRSISENAPILLDVLAKHLNKTRAEVRQLATDGKLTSRVIFEAMSGSAEMLSQQAGGMTVTLGNAMTVLKNNTSALVHELLNGSGTMSVLAGGVKLLADNLGLLVTVGGVVLTVFGGRYAAAMVAAALAKREQIALTLALGRAELASAAAAGRAAAAKTVLAAAGRGLLGVFGGPLGLVFTVGTLLGSWAMMRQASRENALAMLSERKSAAELAKEYTVLSAAQKDAERSRVKEQKSAALDAAAESKAKLYRLTAGGLAAEQTFVQMHGLANNAQLTEARNVKKALESVYDTAVPLGEALDRLKAAGGFPPAKLAEIEDAAKKYREQAGAADYADTKLNQLNGTMGKSQSAAQQGAAGVQFMRQSLEAYTESVKQARNETEKMFSQWSDNDAYNESKLKYLKQGHSELEADRLAQVDVKYGKVQGPGAWGYFADREKALKGAKEADTVRKELEAIKEREREAKKAVSDKVSAGKYISPYSGNYRISSGLGYRIHPVLKVRKFHAGVDVAMPVGTPLRAMADGKITRVKSDKNGYGHYVDVQHYDGKSTRYAHLSRYAPNIKVGSAVQAGQTIAYSGNTGRSTGAHLHIEARDARGKLMDFRNLIGKKAVSNIHGALAGMDMTDFVPDLGQPKKSPAEQAIESLKEQKALLGKDSELGKQQASVALGKYEGITADEKKELFALAGAIDAYNTAEKDRQKLKSFRDGAGKELASLQLEASLVGKNADEAERLRFTHEWGNKVREASVGLSADGVRALEKEAESYRAQYEAVIRLNQEKIKQKQVDDFSKDVNKDLDAMAFEIGLIGRSAQEIDRLRFARDLDNQAKELSVGWSERERQALLRVTDAAKQRYDELMRERERLNGDWKGGLSDGIGRYMQSLGTLRQNTEKLIVGSFEKMEQSLADFVVTGKADFRGLAQSILEDIGKMMVKMALFNALKSGFSAMGWNIPGLTAQADGGAWHGGLQFFASGGVFTNQVVGKPTLFAHGGGFGVMGEAGPEAIMPLSRGADGKLGVALHGGMPAGGVQNNVSVNVVVHNGEAGESSEAADNQNMGRLGKALKAAVLNVLAEEIRSGGLLEQRFVPR